MIPGAWNARPGLAGGIDKDGSRAAELLALGFAGVEFGTVAPLDQSSPASDQPTVEALVARLAALDPRHRGDTAIGIGLGMRSGGDARNLAADWLAGLHAAYGVADYLSFNLSARACRPLLAETNGALLAQAIAGVAERRAHRVARGGRRVALALKLPLGPDPWRIPAAAALAAEAGFDALIAVLPDDGARLACLRELAGELREKTHGKMRSRIALLAVGGLRTAADVRAALAAGADGVQVHSAFAECGAACLPPLLAGFSGVQPSMRR